MMLTEMEDIKTSRVVYKIEKTKRNKGIHKKTFKRKANLHKYREIGKEKVFDHVFNMMWCSYIKHGEIGKKNRRAIASANALLRMFLFLIDVHLTFSEELTGSVAVIGGEAKKFKFILNLTTTQEGSVLVFKER